MAKGKGILLAAPSSGSGKTSAACALMAAFQASGYKVRSCKCGPDYIDPMFHREVLGIESENLDLFFSDAEQLKTLYEEQTNGADFVVVEGVMGYYDGMSLSTEKGSSYEVAKTLGLPVILVVPGKGAALSLAALIRGMVEFRSDSQIRGILLNRISPMLYPKLKEMLEAELEKAGYEIPVIGYLPEDPLFHLESRHLGLVTPQELEGLRERLMLAGEKVKETVEMERLVEIAEKEETEKTGEASDVWNRGVEYQREIPAESSLLDAESESNTVNIGIAQDRAFCFYYKENLRLLERLGCRMIPFSPLEDEQIPEGLDGLLLGGGYPELYADRLSANLSMKESIRQAISQGMPCLAECGGFMYLHEELTTTEGETFSMAGVIKGATRPAGRLVRFGYITIGPAGEEGTYLKKGETIRGHEFHYWDSTQAGNSCRAVKPDGIRSWECIHMDGNLFAGYPHLYLPSLPEFGKRFVEECKRWKRRCIDENLLLD